MVKGLAKATVCGNITRDPEVRTTPNGTQVTSFGMAVNRNYRDASGTNREEVSFFNIVAWSKAGEIIAQYCKKGDPILISGRLTQRTWEDKNGGGKRSTVEIIVEDFSFLGGGNGNGDYSANSSSYSANTSSTSGSKATNKPAEDVNNQEIVPDDIPMDGDVALDEIPF